ncbi:hypothetical protein [Glycomyces arizonensis]|uniref:hypothetical protein n=1 Tax=Glycomyces arizonensis TaxID=256035 RepID=UPI0004051A57|nr:hypothetical protein [Glycomyces arizonensis]
MTAVGQTAADNPWFRWPRPPKAKRMEALDDRAAAGSDREEMNEAVPAQAGRLRIRSLAYGRITALDQARDWKGRRDSAVPVFAVDGRPVAAGYGTLAMPLEPGPHVVTVQTQDSEDDCCTALAVDGGRGAALDYVAPYFSWKAAPETADVSMHGRLGPVGLLPEGWPSGLDGGPWRGAVPAAVAAAVLAGAATAVLGPPDSAALTAALIVLPALAVGAAVALLVGRRRRGRAEAAEARNAARLSTPPVEFAAHEDGPVRHGQRGPDASPQDPSRALIVLRQELRQWTDPLPEAPLVGGASLLPQVECFTPPPRLTIGERPLTPGWGTWTVEVPPGRHRLGASIGGAQAARDVEAEPGGLVEVTVAVRMERTWSGPGPEAALTAETPSVDLATGRSTPRGGRR